MHPTRRNAPLGARLLNLAALVLLVTSPLPAQTRDQVATKSNGRASQTAIFAGGCFWGVEAVFEHLNGVTSAVSGYAGGALDAPSYEEVSEGTTGHAESVRVTYDPSQISYQRLLEVFFTVAHDPTQFNRQGPDIGTQYRSAVFYANEAQKQAAQAVVARLAAAKTFRRPIVTAIEPLKNFYEAEGYHQDYLRYHPNQRYIVINDLPKLAHLKRAFPSLWRDGRTN